MSETTSYDTGDSAGTSKTDAAKQAAGETAATAKEQAAGVGQTAAAAGQQVAATAKEQGSQVVAEAANQARDLLGEARSQAQSQAGVQKDRAVTSVRSLADELQALVNGEGGQSGIATEIARQASERLHEVAGWVESREPGDLLTEAKEFARRKPGTFLIGAAVAGLMAGRITRSTVAAVHEDSDDTASVPARTYPSSDAYAAPTTYATETYATDALTAGGTSAGGAYSTGTGYPTGSIADPALETVDVRPETSGVGYGTRP
ncbi:hypothetical protein CLV35_2160 [Motilibacter peucedani]|uniref:Uncharacterized protein n=1 Tax=Motilibacter peucedani TaxID=598650 RepID=A0A420XQW4_9ACTN|nr:hypothetical protein [Motilibacter peucedani]RKS75683.1 hypothetical protein CLV35_2160 [Motilibacter peucedani]